MITSLLPNYRTALLRIRPGTRGTDRVAVNTALRKSDTALQLVLRVYGYETGQGRRPLLSFSNSSLQKLNDIERSGGIPNAALIAVIGRSGDAGAIQQAGLLRSSWDTIMRWRAGPQTRTAYFPIPSGGSGSKGPRLPSGPTPEEVEAEAQRVAEAARLREVEAAAAAEARRVAEAAAAAEIAAAEERRAAEIQRRVEEELQRLRDAGEAASKTVEDVIEDVSAEVPPVPTLEQLVPGTSAAPPDRKWLWIGAGVVGLGVVGYLVVGK